jgi:hypothetical protein
MSLKIKNLTIKKLIIHFVIWFENNYSKCWFDMENKQFEMFKNSKPSGLTIVPEQNNDVTDPDHILITSTDHQIIEIVSTYINKLPDIHTQKHLARVMINFIMKSAKL